VAVGVALVEKLDSPTVYFDHAEPRSWSPPLCILTTQRPKAGPTVYFDHAEPRSWSPPLCLLTTQRPEAGPAVYFDHAALGSAPLEDYAPLACTDATGVVNQAKLMRIQAMLQHFYVAFAATYSRQACGAEQQVAAAACSSPGFSGPPRRQT
jgi:hypothetical protein